MTPFGDRVKILGNFYAAALGDTSSEIAATTLWTDHQDTLIACLFSNVGYVDILPKFHVFVDDTWDVFCDTYGVDSHGEYDSLNEFLEIANA